MVFFISDNTPANSTPVAPPPTITILSNSCRKTGSFVVIARSIFANMVLRIPVASDRDFMGIAALSISLLPKKLVVAPADNTK